MTELVERVCAPGDLCGVCGEDLEPGDLAIWTDLDGRVHESCCENDSQRGSDTDLCKCGHEREAHDHYRRGRDCSLCYCKQFRRARG